MAANPFLGSDFEVYVLDTSVSPPSYVPVDDMNNFQRSTSRDKQTFPVFMRLTAHVIPGARGVTYTLSGFLDSGSTGQDILRAAEQNDNVVTMKFLWDGTNGFTQDVKVGSTSQNTTPEGLQETSFELLADADPVIVGSGPLV
jgi:hypothetical protein